MKARWEAVVEYRADAGIVDVTHNFDELDEIHDLIERGPHWGAIEKITITLNRKIPGQDNMTIEQAEKL